MSRWRCPFKWPRSAQLNQITTTNTITTRSLIRARSAGPNGMQAPFFPRFGVLNNHGTLVGTANTPAWDPYCGCNAGDAFQYKDGVTTDLGRVPGGIDSQANWISGNGLIAGLGDDGIPDPLAGFPIPHLHGFFGTTGS